MQSHDFPPSACFSPFLFLYHFYQLSNNHATPNLLHFLPEYVTLKSFHLELWAGQRPGMAPEALPEALARVRRPAARDGPRGVTGSPCEGTQATRQGRPTIHDGSARGPTASYIVGPPQATRLTFYHKFDRQLVIESKRKLSARKESCDDATIDAVVATAVGRGYLWFGPVGRSTAKSSCRCHCARVGDRDGSLVAQATA